jgi:hypothetical protein
MKPIKSLLILLIVLSPAIAAAQGYYSPGYRERGGFHHRMGRVAYGASLGVGFMNDNGGALSCDNCGNYSPYAVEGDFHIGAFVAPRFALLFEGQLNGQQVHAADGTTDGATVYQSAFMLAGQFWLTPILWVKGGIGIAHLSVGDDYTGGSTDVDNGFAIMGAAGIELISTRFFALDLQARIINGSYSGVDDNITSGTVGIGLNWY